MSGDPKNILIIKPSAVGDVVHALPVLQLLRTRYPAARISWLVTPACAGLLEGHPLLDEVILFDRKYFSAGWKSWAVLWDLYRFTRGLRGRSFDLVLDMQGLFRSGWLAWMTGAEVRLGEKRSREGATLFHTRRVDTGRADRHAIDRYLKIAEAAGCEVGGEVKFVFNTDEAVIGQVEELLAPLGGRQFALLVPGTNWPTKRWPAWYFRQLGERVRQEHGLAIVTTGAPHERELCREVGADLDLAGKTTLRQLPVLLQRAALAVVNDSGPMHIAAAIGTPMVAMFGPTNPLRTGPYRRELSVLRAGLPCSPCYSRACVHGSCLKLITPEVAAGRAREMVRGTGGGGG
jgi:lipopolysaccharide heptosyltransferase I